VPVVAVKVWSDRLGEAIWGVTDDLPRDDWPTDAPVYTQAELKLLAQVGHDALACVHAVRQLFGGTVIYGGRRKRARPQRGLV
jgi:hypothetical protein